MAQNDENNNILTHNEATREYTIEASHLDPLASWVKSRQTIEHYLDDQYIGYNLHGRDPYLTFHIVPGFVDQQTIYTIRGEDELVGFLKALNPELQNQEGLRYLYHGELPPNSQEEYNFLGKYVYINPSYRLESPQGNEVKYKNFATDILKTIINTASSVFSLTKDDDFFRLKLKTLDQTTTFYRTVVTIARDSGVIDLPYGTMNDYLANLGISPNLLERTVDRAFRNVTRPGYPPGLSVGGYENLGTGNVYAMVYGSIDQAIADGISEAHLAILQQTLLRALLDAELITEFQVFSSISRKREYEFSKDEVKVNTPYVKNIENASWLSRSPVQSAALTSQYTVYNDKYERAIRETDPSEEILPNLYVRQYTQLSSNRGTTRQYQPLQIARITKYKNLLKLSDSARFIENLFGTEFYRDLLTAMNGGDPERFYSLYGQLLEEGFDVSTVIQNSNKLFIMGLKEARRPGGAFGSPGAAMSMNVKFSAAGASGLNEGGSEVNDYQRYELERNNVGREQYSDTSVAALQNLATYDTVDPDQPELSQGYLYSTEYLYNDVTNTTLKNNVNLRVYPINMGEFSYIFDNTPEASSYTATLLQRQPMLPNEEEMLTAKQFLLRNALFRSRHRYENIIYGHHNTKSEVLGYQIGKSRANAPETLQEILVGNPVGSQVYRDSQVAYGRDYDYTLTEYRFIYDTPYNQYTISRDIPLKLMMYYLGIGGPDDGHVLPRNLYDDPEEYFEERLVGASFAFKSMISCGSNVKLVQIPVYDSEWNRVNVFENMTTLIDRNRPALLSLSDKHRGAGGISYPRLSVLDLPPTAPTLQFFPRLNQDNQIMLNIDVESGREGTIIPDYGTYANTLKIVRIGDNNETIDRSYAHQRTVMNLPENTMMFRNKGQTQIKSIILYRTTNLNLDVDDYDDLYKDFNPNTQNDVLVREFTDDRLAALEDETLSYILSYDLDDNIEPNVDYYYTCITKDIHEQISNPSVIYRIKLVSENGMVIPEISTVLPAGTSKQVPDKDLARFVKIDASNIQTFPYIQNRDGETVSARSLASTLGSSIEDDAYIIRFTSKDTGRKFDLKLDFVIKVDGRPINGET